MSATACLKELHWLPIALRIKYKTLVLVYKCIHSDAPEYLCELIKFYQPTRSGLRSGSNQLMLNVPTSAKKTHAERSFSIAGPRWWNELSNNMKLSESLEVFKKVLKTNLFSKF